MKYSLIPTKEICMIKLAQLLTILMLDFKIKIYSISLEMEALEELAEEEELVKKIFNQFLRIFLEEWEETDVEEEREALNMNK